MNCAAFLPRVSRTTRWLRNCKSAVGASSWSCLFAAQICNQTISRSISAMISIPGAARIKALRRDRVWMLRCMCYAFLAGGLTSHAPADGVSSSITFYPGFGPIYYEDGDLLRAASWSCFSGYTDHRVVDWCGWHGEQTFDFPLDSGACSNSWTRLDGGANLRPSSPVRSPRIH